jgi:hypothetical protein
MPNRERLTLKVSLKTKEDTEVAVKFLSDTIQWADWNAMPEHKTHLIQIIVI